MLIKDKFELIYGKSGNVYNIMPIRRPTLAPYQISKDDFFHLKILANSVAKTHVSGKLVLDNIDKAMAVRIPEYPLPGFITKDGIAVVNLSVLSSEHVSDYSTSDIYSMFLYAISLKIFATAKPFEKEIENHVAEFIMSKFMSLFGKKYGLTGSHSDLIPHMQVIIALYVHSAMMGYPLDETEINKMSSKFLTDANDLKNIQNLNTTIGFLRALKTNDIIPLSENKFSTTIINLAGVSSLPLFEDVSRFFATLLACSVSGNSQFSRYWGKGNRKMFEKLVQIADINAKRAS
jgi:hypothetical protein